MAGEWLPIDCNLGMKPEVLKVTAATGQPVEVVIGRLVRLWSWAWLVTADGTVDGSLAMLSSVAGGDEPFWQAVEQAGWLVVSDGKLTIPGWGDRFSQAAKSRALAARRQETWRKRHSNADRNAPALPEEKRGEEKRRENTVTAAPSPASRPLRVRSPAADGPRWTPAAGWEGITDTDRADWAKAYPAASLDQELAKASAWLKANPERAKRKNWRRFLTNWLTRCQDKGGSNRGVPGNRPAYDDKPPSRTWSEADKAAFEATKRKLAAGVRTA
jgi:hypothetical protein